MPPLMPCNDDAHCTNLDSPEHYLFFSGLPQCHGSWLSDCTSLAALLGMSMLVCMSASVLRFRVQITSPDLELKVSTSVVSQSQSVLTAGEDSATSSPVNASKIYFFLSIKENNFCEVQDSCSVAMIMKTVSINARYSPSSDFNWSSSTFGFLHS